MSIAYTPDADFDELTDRDPTTELIGYVDHVIAPTKVGSKGKVYDLFKFVLSNGSERKVLCLIWSMDLIEKYTKDITAHRILHIDGAYTKVGIMNHEKSTLNVLPIEIIIQKSTIVEYLGVHVVPSATPLAEKPNEVTFDTITAATGLISIKGYVKTKFVRSDSRFQTMSYGCGAITDGQYKVTVQVANYEEIKLEKGVYVTVVGKLMNNDGFLKISCKDSNCITPDFEHAVMTADNLLRGSKTPKRKVNED